MLSLFGVSLLHYMSRSKRFDIPSITDLSFPFSIYYTLK